MFSIQPEPADASRSRPWPADKVEHWPIERLIPYVYSPRVHSEADLDKLDDAIDKWGWTMPVLVDEQGGVIAGEARLRVAQRRKQASIPVVVARGWSEEEKRAYRLADNQLALRASWEPDLLRAELQALGFTGFNLDLLGFESDRLQAILDILGSSGLTDPDSIPEIPEQPVTWPGDIWQLGDHRVGCGDSTDAVNIEAVLAGTQPDVMVTDPPYGVDYDPSWRARHGFSGGKLATDKVLNDDRADWRQAYALFSGDVAYVWHGALRGNVVGADLDGLPVAAARPDRLDTTALHAEPWRLSLEARMLLLRGARA